MKSLLEKDVILLSNIVNQEDDVAYYYTLRYVYMLKQYESVRSGWDITEHAQIWADTLPDVAKVIEEIGPTDHLMTYDL